MSKELGTIGDSLPAAIMPTTFEQVTRMGEILANSKMVPSGLQGNAADCTLIAMQAVQWGMNPFAVAQCMSVVSGKLCYEGKLIAAVVNSSGFIKGRVQYEYSGEGENRKIKVWATLKDGSTPPAVELVLKEAKTKFWDKDKKEWKPAAAWGGDTDQMLAYKGVRVWARRYTPEVILGVYAPDEIEEISGDNRPGSESNPITLDIEKKDDAAILSETPNQEVIDSKTGEVITPKQETAPDEAQDDPHKKELFLSTLKKRAKSAGLPDDDIKRQMAQFLEMDEPDNLEDFTIKQIELFGKYLADMQK